MTTLYVLRANRTWMHNERWPHSQSNPDRPVHLKGQYVGISPHQRVEFSKARFFETPEKCRRYFVQTYAQDQAAMFDIVPITIQEPDEMDGLETAAPKR